MHRRLVPRVLAGLVLAGSLAACDLGGGTPGALISAAPNPVVVDLPDDEIGADLATITVRNLGPSETAALGIVFDTDGTDPADVVAYTFVPGTCANATLGQNETCEVYFKIKGIEPNHPYDIHVDISGANTNTVRVQVLIR